MDSKTQRKLKIVIAGGPASGKGTACERIKDKYGVVHVSTGDMFRDHISRGTELGTLLHLLLILCIR